MAEVVFEVVAVVLEDVEAFVLDFPPCPGASRDLDDVLACDLERGDEGAVIGRLALGVADGDADPSDIEGVLSLAQRRSRKPSVAISLASWRPLSSPARRHRSRRHS